MGPISIKLSTALSQVIRMLEQDGQSHWSDRLSQARDDLLASDSFGANSILSVYEGEDPFDDVSIRNVSKKNESFAELRGEIRALAKEIEHQNRESK